MTDKIEIRIATIDTLDEMVAYYKRLGYEVEVTTLYDGTFILKAGEPPKSIPIITDDLVIIFEEA